MLCRATSSFVKMFCWFILFLMLEGVMCRVGVSGSAREMVSVKKSIDRGLRT